MSERPMMRCGHAANGQRVEKDGTKIPCCVICSMGRDGEASVTIDPSPPSLDGREARCAYFGKGFGRSMECNYDCKRRDGACSCLRPSSTDLPFFEHKGGEDFDRFYCGCHGWD